MIPDPADNRNAKPPGGAGGPARDDSSCRSSRAAGLTCWLCGYAITDPPHIIGHRDANGRLRVAHRHCQQTLGELDLNLPFPSSR